jgi:DNA-directed RNA polymerase subunit RPC12/RpoP
MICPNLKCGRTVAAPDMARGKVVRCAHCHQLFLVPVPSAAPRREEQPEPSRPPAKTEKEA